MFLRRIAIRILRIVEELAQGLDLVDLAVRLNLLGGFISGFELGLVNVPLPDRLVRASDQRSQQCRHQLHKSPRPGHAAVFQVWPKHS